MKMTQLAISEGSFLDFRETPWDQRSLGLNAIEILEIQYGGEAGLDALLKSLDKHCVANRVDLAYLRIDALDKRLKKALNHAGFEFIETSLKMAHQNMQKYDFGKIIPPRFQLQQPSGEDIPQIKRIAYDAFDFSRFHEDYNISESGARQRYADWIDDLLKQDRKFLVYKPAGCVRSFLAYDEPMTGIVNLVLAGSEKSQGYLSPFFWSSFLAKLKNDGATRVETTISAANVPIINLYARFGFVVEKTCFGFHKYFHNQSGS